MKKIQDWILKLPKVKKLSTRQYQIMELMCLGATTKEIAKTLGGAPSTIETHVKIIFEKLSAKNRSNAVFIFARLIFDQKDAIDDHEQAEPCATSREHLMI